MRARHLGNILIGLAVMLVALSGWASGLDLLKEGPAAEKAGNRNAALEAYGQAIRAGDLTGSQLSLINPTE